MISSLSVHTFTTIVLPDKRGFWLTLKHLSHTRKPLNDTIVGVQVSFRVSYPAYIILRVKCIGYIGKGVLNSHLGSISDLCYIQNHVITNCVIKRFRCMLLKVLLLEPGHNRTYKECEPGKNSDQYVHQWFSIGGQLSVNSSVKV